VLWLAPNDKETCGPSSLVRAAGALGAGWCCLRACAHVRWLASDDKETCGPTLSGVGWQEHRALVWPVRAGCVYFSKCFLTFVPSSPGHFVEPGMGNKMLACVATWTTVPKSAYRFLQL